MASTNKCLAQSNKSRMGGKATKKRRNLPAAKLIEVIEEIVDESAPWPIRRRRSRPRRGRQGEDGRSAPGGRSNDARQVRGDRCRRQGAQAQQQEPRLLALRRDPLRSAPAEQVLAQGRGGLQPRRMGGKPRAR